MLAAVQGPPACLDVRTVAELVRVPKSWRAVCILANAATGTALRALRKSGDSRRSPRASGLSRRQNCSGTRESSEGLAGGLHSCECSYEDGAPRRERAAMLAAVQGPPAILGFRTVAELVRVPKSWRASLHSCECSYGDGAPRLERERRCSPQSKGLRLVWAAPERHQLTAVGEAQRRAGFSTRLPWKGRSSRPRRSAP